MTVIPASRAKSSMLKVTMCVMPCKFIAATSRASWAFLPATAYRVTRSRHSPILPQFTKAPLDFSIEIILVMVVIGKCRIDLRKGQMRILQVDLLRA